MKRSEIAGYAVFCGIDVGKTSNHVVAMGADGEDPFLSEPVAQGERELRDVPGRASGRGRTLVTVDQVGAFGRLAAAVARDMGLDVAHMPPRKFAQAAETYGEDKAGRLDACIVADAARSSPRLVELVGERPEAIAEIKAVASCRDDAVRERTRCYNRLHGLIHQECPALEAVFSKEKLHNDLEIRLIARYGGPMGLRRAGKKRASEWASGLKHHCRRGPERVEEAFEALSRQTVRLPGAAAIEEQVKGAAKRAIDPEAEEERLNAGPDRPSAALPEVALLMGIPGVGRVYGAAIAAEIGDIGRFGDAAHLASYAGVATGRKESGSSLKKSKERKGGNRRLKNALIESARIAIESDARARAYYDRKRSEGKKHVQALRALARRRVEAIYAMPVSGAPYAPLTEAA